MKNLMLSENQKKAAMHGAGAAMVLSGAGSGKTRVLCGRYRYLRTARKVPAGRIVLIAPNARAAGRMERLIAEMLPEGLSLEGRGVETFPSFANALLRAGADRLGYGVDYSVYDEDDRFGLIRSILKEFKIHEALFRGIAVRIDGLKARRITPEAFLQMEGGFGFEEKLARVYLRYQDELRKNNAMDTGDLVMQAVRLLDEHDGDKAVRKRIAHVLVDDFQDITPAQYELVRLLMAGGAKVFVAADDDQGILGHRGAELEFIDRFSTDFPGAKIYRLERSYRCTSCILEAAGAILRDHSGRRRKTIRSDRDRGQKPRYFHAGSEAEEAAYIVNSIRELFFAGRYAYRDFAILYRMNSQLRPLEDALRREDVPYRIQTGRAFFHRPEVRDALAYLRLVVNPADAVGLKRIVNTPPRGMGESTLARISETARKEGRSFFETLRAASKTRKSLARARKLLDLVRRLRKDDADAGRLLGVLLEKAGYIEWLAGEKNGAERLENVRTLVDLAAGRSPVEFLDAVVLGAPPAGADAEPDAVSLMTVYEARGLQFPVVYMPGLEEGVLPRVQGHHESPGSIEEERRLLYVGMTRARDMLFLSGAARRRLYSRIQIQKPSRFLDDLSEKLCSVVERAPSAPEKPAAAPKRVRTQGGGRGTPFPVGARVRHTTWGAGVVRDYVGKGESAKVTVNFPGVGVKRLALKYANLEVLN